MKNAKVLSGVAFSLLTVLSSRAFAAGVWDDNATLLGVNPNGNYQGSDEVRIKKATAGSSGCTVVKFRPGFGNITSDANGIAARDRIYATALAAYGR